MSQETNELTKAEQIKVESNGLRGTIRDELADTEIKKFSNANESILKFHGMYQQKDRDRRPKELKHLGPKPFTVMIRGRIAGGRLSASQWAAWDKVAELYGTEGLRLTSRQSLQLHGVVRSDIQGVTREIAKELSTTTGACGDVVRNVMVAPNPTGNPQISALNEPADLISKHLEVRSPSFFEIFVDGEVSYASPVEEPIYGTQFLPRKFKIGMTVEGNNTIDLFTQDMSLVATFDSGDAIAGYHVFVGGGMGIAHNNPETFPRLADHLGWVPHSALIRVSEAIVTTQRDFGDRNDRSHARLKYTIHDRGIEWFREEVETRSGFVFEEKTYADWDSPEVLGWHQHVDGSLSLGVHLLSGRLKDEEVRQAKSAVRHLVAAYELDVQLTAEQDLILYGIPSDEQRVVNDILAKYGIDPRSPSKLYDRAMTCVALPMCSKALAEGERMGPEFFRTVNHLLLKHGLAERAPTIRITGCPNGCARPYAAEIGLVGQLPNKYAIYIGGSGEGTRLAERIQEKVHIDDIPDLLERLFTDWKANSAADERFGDYISRIGHESIAPLAAVPIETEAQQ